MSYLEKYKYYKNLYLQHIAGSSQSIIPNINCEKIITMNLAGAQENPFEFLEQPFTILPNAIFNGVMGSSDTISEVLNKLPSFKEGIKTLCLQCKTKSKSKELEDLLLDLKIVDFFNLLKNNEDLIKKIDGKTKKAPTLLYASKEFCDNRWWTSDAWQSKLTTFILSKTKEFEKDPLKGSELKEPNPLPEDLNMTKLNENLLTTPGRMLIFFIFHTFIIFSFVKALDDTNYNRDVLKYFSGLTKEFGESTKIFQRNWYHAHSKNILLLQEAKNADGSEDTTIHLPKLKKEDLLVDCSDICSKIIEVKKTKKNINLGKGTVFLETDKMCCKGPISINSQGPVYLFSVHSPSDGQTTNNILTEIDNHHSNNSNASYIIGIDSNVKDKQAINFIKHFIKLGWTSIINLDTIIGEDGSLVKSDDDKTMLENYLRMVQNINGSLNGPWDKNEGGGFTVNKERTLLQSQITKANNLDKNLKDFVLVKGELSKFIIEEKWGGTINNGVFEGEAQPNIFSSYQPSDHFSVEMHLS